MADPRTADLPEGTDTIIEPAEPENSGAIATDRAADDEGGTTLTIDDPAIAVVTAPPFARITPELELLTVAMPPALMVAPPLPFCSMRPKLFTVTSSCALIVMPPLAFA